MSAFSNIEWTDHTFNPWEGCQKVGPGCDHCYAETRNARFGGGTAKNWGPGAPRRRTSASNWVLPKRWNAQAEAFQAQHGRRQRVFCASLADVFDNAVPQLWRTSLFGLIYDTPHLDWLLLTKRISNAARMLKEDPPEGIDMAALPNLWLGATIANQPEADRDISKLLAVPAAKHFLSMEPLLSRVYIEEIPDPASGVCLKPLAGVRWVGNGQGRCETQSLGARIDWVIVGGESGPQARPMHPDWARSLRDQCQAAGVPFFFKQWGEWLPLSHQGSGADREERQCYIWPDGRAYDGDREEMTPACAQLSRVGKKAAGRLLDGREWNEVPR